MKRALGAMMALFGFPATAFIIFMAFDGKYGMRQFWTSLERLDGDFGIASLAVVPLAVLVWGLVLLFKIGDKKPE